MVRRLWRLTSLVQPLVSISAKFQYGSSSEIICNICKGSPQTRELSLDLRGINEAVPAAVRDYIGTLPLQRLRLMSSGVIGELTSLISPMTNLEYLDMDYIYLSIKDLIIIAKYMPKLRLLSSIYLNLDDWPLEVEPDSVTPSPSTLCLVAAFPLRQSFNYWRRIKKNKTMEEYLGNIAQYVGSLLKIRSL
ncbi:hypothetical protein FRC10_011800 [Ceratobasidium sp. 414]|nr:hypothetical protein FRC10_011800 [Ceratobasidium sp. 414]